MLETAVLSDDWGQSLCGWMDIECSNSSVSTTISGDRAASGAARNATIGPDSLFQQPIFLFFALPPVDLHWFFEMFSVTG